MSERGQPNLEFRVVRPSDVSALEDVFADIDDTHFRPHPFTRSVASDLAGHQGQDAYCLLVDGDRAVAYGMLRGFDEGYAVPSLGIAVRTSEHRRGLGRTMMLHLHDEAARRGASIVRLRVHPANIRARRLYESLGYAYAGQDRGELVMLVAVGPGGRHEASSGHAREFMGEIVGVDSARWRDVLRGVRHDFHHLPGYVELCAAEEGAQGCALHVSDGDRTLLLPLMIRQIEGGGLDAVSPYGYPGPIGIGTGDREFLTLALVAGLQVLREAKVVSLFLRFHPLLNDVLPGGVGTLVLHGDTIVIDLAEPAEKQWAATRTNHKRDIKRAIGLGYAARMDGDFERFDDFKRLYRSTMRRRGASGFYDFTDEYFEAMRQALGERLNLCVVEREGAVAAAGLFVETDGLVEYHLSGTDEEHVSVQPTKLMIHAASDWGRRRGNRALHLGGGVGGSEDSLLHFKAGFSSRRHKFATLRTVIDEAEYNRLVEARDPALDASDRRGFFPLYRLP